MRSVSTVLGPVPAAELGVVALHESLLSVLPGAQYGYDVALDRAEIFATIAARLAAFRAAGGGTIVDATGMYHGRDLPLYEALSRAIGVHIVASTGMGPEAMLGGYFLTPQTDPPTPWPADRFAELFAAEATEGMVVPRLERRASAGLIVTAATREGMTATDESLFRGAARAALATGVPVSIRHGADALADLEVLLSEGLPASRVVLAGMDRRDAAPATARKVASLGAYVAIDHVGSADPEHLDDAERTALVAELAAAGHGNRILLSSGAVGVAIGHEPPSHEFATMLQGFIPALRTTGLSAEDLDLILVANPRRVLTGEA